MRTVRSIKAWVVCLLTAVAAPTVIAAQPAEVLVLGTYHFSNPGLDVANVTVDDVLTPERQTQVRAVVAGLAAFRPTRVVVEAQADKLPHASLPRYRDYLAGKGTEDRNEIVQIGYRLAREARLADVQGIDAEGSFPFEAVMNWARAQNQEAAFQRGLDEVNARVKQIEAQHRDGGVPLALRELNRPDVIAADHGWYMNILRHGSGAEQPGALLVGSWYARNIAICARLVQMIRPGERVVVLYGSGHGFLLRHCVQTQPGWRLVEANDYLPR